MNGPTTNSNSARRRFDSRPAAAFCPIVPSCSSPSVLSGSWSLKWAAVALALLSVVAHVGAQTEAVVQGRVFDVSGGVLPGATVSLHNDSTGFSVSVSAGPDGRYYIAAIPAATYTIMVDAPGFRAEIIEELIVEVGRTVVRDFRLAVGSQNETVVVRAEVPLVDRATTTLGHVVTEQTVQQIPLNGRHFTDLGLLVPGSVAPSQTGFSSRPTRGTGAVAINTAGNREEAVAFVVNGVTTNNLTFGSLIFEPPLGSIQELKVENSAFGPEQGHVSGAIINVVTRSGTNQFHGDVFDYERNDALDARNFFELTTSDPAPVREASVRRIARRPHHARTNLLLCRRRELQTAAGHRHEQPRAQRRAARGSDRSGHSEVDSADPSRELLSMRTGPRDSSVRPRLSSIRIAGRSISGTTPAANDRFHAFYGAQRLRMIEPGSQGNSIPGFGHVRQPSHEHADHQRNAPVRSRSLERSTVRSKPSERGDVSGCAAESR